MKTILFQGDSITDAYRDRGTDFFLGSGYPTLVSASIGTDRPNAFRFINRGISGNRIVDLLSRIKVDIINLKPDLLSILIGVNDVWRELDSNNGIDAYWFERYYNLIIEQVKAANPDIQIMILEPFLLEGSATAGMWDVFRSEVENRAHAAKRIAEQHGLIFVPLMDAFDKACEKAPADYWLIDGVHPTAMGNEIIKRAWMNAFPL